MRKLESRCSELQTELTMTKAKCEELEAAKAATKDEVIILV